jgi:iron complex outermembrane receptor protein
VSRDTKKIGVLAASWTLRWQKREGDYTSAEGVVTPYKPVLLLDGSIYWQNERVKISAECTNITNRHYYDYGSLLMPGAWGTFAIEVHL